MSILDELTIACGAYDRIMPLVDGRVGVQGLKLRFLYRQPEDLFYRMMRFQEYDASELSLSSYCIARSRGDERFTGLPIFPSRAFRHGMIYVRADDDISDPRSLSGKRIGVPDYEQTAGVWVRGLLSDQYGVSATDVKWVVGGLEGPPLGERQELQLHAPVTVTKLAAGTTLVEALREGGIDAIMAPRTPGAFRQPNGGLRRLWPDYGAMQREYYLRTSLFPIMHLLVLRSDLYERHPWLAAALIEAFREAKDMVLHAIEDLPSLPYSVPLLAPMLEDQREVFGDDPWPYGLKANRHPLETFTRYLSEQGLVEEAPTIESLFPPPTIDT